LPTEVFVLPLDDEQYRPKLTNALQQDRIDSKHGTAPFLSAFQALARAGGVKAARERSERARREAPLGLDAAEHAGKMEKRTERS
jgi:hypothetical protein